MGTYLANSANKISATQLKLAGGRVLLVCHFVVMLKEYLHLKTAQNKVLPKK